MGKTKKGGGINRCRWKVGTLAMSLPGLVIRRVARTTVRVDSSRRAPGNTLLEHLVATSQCCGCGLLAPDKYRFDRLIKTFIPYNLYGEDTWMALSTVDFNRLLYPSEQIRKWDRETAWPNRFSAPDNG
jgi:hypothetical protein